MKKILFVLVGLLFFTLVKPAFAYASEPIYINPFHAGEQPINVSLDQEVILRGLWASCNYGITLSFTKQFVPYVTLDGTPLFSSETDAAKFWLNPVLTDIPITGGECISNYYYNWIAYWEYPLGVLSAGPHNIGYTITFDHPVVDLWDGNNDGKPEHGPSGMIMSASVDLYVE